MVVTTLKAAEDGDGALVMRAYESSGRPARASVALPLVDRAFDAELGAFEIKPLVVPAAADEPVEETNLLEWPEQPGAQPPAAEEPRDEAGPPADEAEAAVAPQEGRAAPKPE